MDANKFYSMNFILRDDGLCEHKFRQYRCDYPAKFTVRSESGSFRDLNVCGNHKRMLAVSPSCNWKNERWKVIYSPCSGI